MKKLWTIAILFNVVFAQLPQPTIVGQDDLQIPTLSINNFVNEAEVVFENLIQVNKNKGIYQYQYKVKQKWRKLLLLLVFCLYCFL